MENKTMCYIQDTTYKDKDVGSSILWAMQQSSGTIRSHFPIIQRSYNVKSPQPCIPI